MTPLENETAVLIRPSGFREYDARWLFPADVNLLGVRRLGQAIGTRLQRAGGAPQIVTGHDFRSYSAAVKDALIIGLMASGCTVHDIGLALTPMAYFAQHALNVDGVAMVTASHNENGWTGVKIGFEKSLTLGPDDMAALKDTVYSGDFIEGGGRLIAVSNIPELYGDDLLARFPPGRKLRAVVACGNGTAGAFAPDILRRAGCDVIELHCRPDYDFPNYNPNPEDIRMLKDMSTSVLKNGADIAFGFDGDGDRCGVVGDDGEEIFADKIGLILARRMSRRHPGCRFVVDIKSTGLYSRDPVLKENGAETVYWKTGHSHMKRRTAELDAIAGFEKSGHYFLRGPYGRGYDDAIASALVIREALGDDLESSISGLYRQLPRTWCSPTMSPHCGDSEKYDVISRITARIETLKDAGAPVSGRRIVDINRINGVRFTLADGSWGLVRASSNKPELTVVCESVRSASDLHDIFGEIDGILSRFPEIGTYNQKIGA